MPVIRRRIDKKAPGNNGWWSDKEKYQAVAAYLLMGKITLVAAATRIPEITLRKWKTAQWWKDAIDEIRRSNKIELSGRLTDVVNKTIVQLEDRVQNGDYFFNPKTGKFERKTIKAIEASQITNNLIDKTLILEKQAITEKETDEGLDARLAKLMEEMKRFAKATTIEGEATHVEDPRTLERISDDSGPSGDGGIRIPEGEGVADVGHPQEVTSHV